MQPNKEKRDKTITERQQKEKALLLEKFRKMPILQIALDKTGIGRTTYYRWRIEDSEFKKQADECLLEGEAYITELSESKLLSMINQEYFPAVQLWLRAHHPKYTSKVELSGNLSVTDESLSPEQEAIVREALRLAATSRPENIIMKESGNEQPIDNSIGVGGQNDQGQESPGGDH